MSPDMPCLKKGQIQDNSHWVVLLILAHDDDDEQNSLLFPHIIKALVRCVTHFHSHVSFHFTDTYVPTRQRMVYSL